MPEKGPSFFRPWIPTGISSLTGALLAAAILIWTLDSCTVDSGTKLWNTSRDYLGVKFGNDENLTHTTTTTPGNLTHATTTTTVNLTHNAVPKTSPAPNPSITTTNQSLTQALSSEPEQNNHHKHLKKQEQETLTWISFPPESNRTETLLARLAKQSSKHNEPCFDSRTETIKVPGLESGNTPEFSAGKIYRFLIFSYDEAGKARCSGGDYFETDLSGNKWKSRPPVQDFGNGSYSMSFQVHPDFSGDYILRIILLFRSYQGLKQSSARWVLQRELLNIKIRFRRDRYRLKPLGICRKDDFRRGFWSGRWTHHGSIDNCPIDHAGRFRCLRPEFKCEKPWCEGNLGSIESTGWVYSTHCSFRIFTSDSAWDCLQNRWLFFWGDSNHVDSIRNLLNFVLGRWDIKSVLRRFDESFTNPVNSSQSVRITNMFNGHWNMTGNYGGLDSLRNEGFQDLLRSYFTGKSLPDIMIMNSGLHDGVHWRNMRGFHEAAVFAAEFWRQVLKNSAGNRKWPEFIFRSTITAAGHARALAFNPQKIEAYNSVLLEQFRRKGLVSGVVDGFDLTYAWHYDNNCSDGVHYGRAPMKANWYGQVGHQYFLDLMLVHVLLNRICPVD